ncbi:TonB-dependent receptor [Sphingomonas mesophila]|uniref:TonB-dependent receptor n=1 Tax=Sphingomonas mesophila TaxID=2303576 RepID=UPI0023DDC581|nr:TonB-dependent receptor [Sphingomonas mesophila]
MRKTSWLLSAAFITLSVPAYAQDTTPQPATPAEAPTDAANVDTASQQAEGADDDAIVITATRRNEALSDVPMAVSAVTADQLEKTGASDIRQVQQISPSLSVASTQSEAGAARANIRGIGTVGDNPGLESSVGVFIDGVYRSRIGTALTELGPIDRVEVLRGPQGTLFGRNTSAGLIHVITAKPRFTPEIYGEATIGNYDLRRFEMGATGPITDSLAARIDGVMVKRDGFVEDLVSGRDVNDRDRWMVRGQALYQPDDNFSLRVIGDYSTRDEECCAAPYLPVSDALGDGSGGATRQPSTFAPLLTGIGGIIPDDTYERDVVISPGRSYRGDVKDWGLSGEATYDFGPAELTSITAYRYNKVIRGTDIDYSNLDFAYRPDDGTAFNQFKTFSQELRLQGTTWGDRFDWLIGGYYANEKLRSRDSNRYGRDFDDLSSCLAAVTFARIANQPGLVTPADGDTCFSSAIAQGVRDAPLASGGLIASFNAAVAGGNLAAATSLAQTITAIGAFARLNNPALLAGPTTIVPAINFSAAPFTNNGFQNLGIVNGAPFLFQDQGFVDDYRQTSNNFALFTHNIFAITPRLKLTLGLRYTTETKKLDATLTDNLTSCAAFTGGSLAQLPCVIPRVPGGLQEYDGKRTENKLSGTAVLSFKPVDRLLTYLSYSRGYKAGGFNLDRTAFSRQISQNSFGLNVAGAVCPQTGAQPLGCVPSTIDQLEFKAETNDAFELGAKYNGTWFDLNVALFHQSFRNFQLNTFNGVNFIVENINSCSDDLNGADSDNSPTTGACDGKERAGVVSKGVEVELFTRPLSNVMWNAGLTYADTRYQDDLVGADGRPLTNALFQLPGRRVSTASPLTLTSSISWTPPIGNSGMRGLVYFDVRHNSKYNTGSDLDIEKTQPAYTVVNGRIGLTGANRAWAIELWAQNLFNEKYQQVAFDAFLQGSCTERGAANGFCNLPSPPNRSNQLYAAFLGDPRMYGLTLRAKWQPAPRVVEEVVEAPPPPPPPPAPATQTCPDGSVILATESCPPPPPPPPPPPEPERG